MSELLSINEAAKVASEYLRKNVTSSNISYLIKYARINKVDINGNSKINKNELIHYYKSNNFLREENWKKELGEELNWALSFDWLKEKDTTKHVHRLHPYKGKFIPQLVEYFLDSHTDDFKKEIYFNPGDTVLDPFCGSGTTLVQSNELGINAIGIDVSQFNALISNAKIASYDLLELEMELNSIILGLRNFIKSKNHIKFENELTSELSEFNYKFFPSPEFKHNVKNKLINENEYGQTKVKQFHLTFEKLIKKFNIEILQANQNTFLNKWYLKPVKDEIDFVFSLIKQIQNGKIKKIISIILSRTIRSCRATTHSDLATLIDPVTEPYYCSKHNKICKPLFSILSWFERYSKDTINRLYEFSKLKTKTFQYCLTGDSTNINIFDGIFKKNQNFGENLEKRKIDGIFSSPPYVGLIDYHEQHSYAYELFGFQRNDDLEIGAMFKGQNKQSKIDYVNAISKVLLNSKQYLKDDYNVFLVANDKNNLYPQIAELAGMKIVNQFVRPVLNRTERDKRAYSEIIFHLKENI